MQLPTLLTILLPLLLLTTQTRALLLVLQQPFAGTRITIHSTKNFTTVTSAIYAEIGLPTNPKFPAIAKNITSYNETGKEEFIAAVDAAVGPHGFMIFQEFNHGFWVPLFNLSTGLGLKRIILGNPLVAISMLQYDLTAGLMVPSEILVRELPANNAGFSGGGTDIVYNLPSALIAGIYGCGQTGDDTEDQKRDGRMQTCDENAQALLKAAQNLDALLEDLVQFVAA